MTELNPYDTGQRLEPHVWVHDGRAAPNGDERPADAGDFGRVDFDGDDGTTVLTLFVERIRYGYRLRVEQHSDHNLDAVGVPQAPILRGPSAELDVEYRARQSMLLQAAMVQIATELDDTITIGNLDPLTVSHGHCVLSTQHLVGTWFGITAIPDRDISREDPDLVPIGWKWQEIGRIQLPDGRRSTEVMAEGTTSPSDIDHLITRARAWAHAVVQKEPEATTRAPGRPMGIPKRDIDRL